MARLIAFVAALSALVAGAVWLADRPGVVMVEWQGWRLDTTVPVLVVLLVVLVGLIALALRLVRLLLGLPARWSKARTRARERKGYRALVGGLTAVAAGDPHGARRFAQRADALLADPALTGLLSAQAAAMAGDRAAARRAYEAMLERPETLFLGLRGLIGLARDEGDQAAALDHARRAHGLNPESAEVTRQLFELEARAGQWADAARTLADGTRHRAFVGDQAHRLRAVVLTARARDMSADQAGEAARLARQAREADPRFVPAAALEAVLLGRRGNQRKADALLQAAWTLAPHPDLIRAADQVHAGEDPLQRARRTDRLVAGAAAHPLSQLAAGEAALAARLWGPARQHLNAAAQARPTATVWRLLARLEDEEKGDAAAAGKWLALAAAAPADPVWRCTACGQPAAEWSALCPSCGALDGLAWREPPPAGALPAPAMAAAAL